MTTIRVVLADDQVLVRSGFRALLDAEDDIEVVGEAADGAAAIEVVRATRPDLVLMDIRMPAMDGLEAARRLGDDPATIAVKVLVLTTFELDEYVYEALRAGASGFLLKHTEPAELIRAVRGRRGRRRLARPERDPSAHRAVHRASARSHDRPPAGATAHRTRA